MRTLKVVFTLSCLLFSTPAWAASILFGAAGNGSGISPGGLFTVNQTNGAGTFIGDGVTPGGITGLVFDVTGTLYGTTIGGARSTSNLVTLDPVTGAVLTTVALGISIGDLALDPLTNTLYGIRSNADFVGPGGALYTISPTGTATLVGNTGEGRGGGIAFDAAGQLYFLEFDQLHLVNKLTAAVTATFAVSGLVGEGLAIRPSDGLLFAGVAGAGTAIYTLNGDGTGVTQIGVTGNGSLSDLAFTPDVAPVPEPSTLMLFGTGIVAAVAARRRMRNRV